MLAGVLQWLLHLVTLICASRFMNQIDLVYFASGTEEIGGFDFGWGKLLSWVTWILLFVPMALAAFIAFSLSRSSSSATK